VKMGYRQISKEKSKEGEGWAKPFGHSLLVFKDISQRWECWFFAANEELVIWDSDTYDGKGDERDFLYWLKTAETYHSRSVDSGLGLTSKGMEFLTIDQMAEMMCCVDSTFKY